VTTYVGIRELKAKLSHYLECAASGETIVVTDRGRAKVEIGPLSVESRLEQLVQDGRVTPPRHPGQPSVALLGFKGKRAIAETFDEDRGT
jgi:prevent-host-death family protein